MTLKEIETEVLKRHPLIVCTDDCLGEPRIDGSRVSVCCVLDALRQTGSFAGIPEEWSWTYSEEQYKAAVDFASDFLHTLYKHGEWTSSPFIQSTDIGLSTGASSLFTTLLDG